MALVAFMFGWLIALMGAVGLLAPSALLALVSQLRNPFGLFLAAALRIVLGAALVVAAPRSRAPGIFRVLGAITIGAGVLLPFLGFERFDRILGWWTMQGAATTRLSAALAMTLGVLIAYGIIPREAR